MKVMAVPLEETLIGGGRRRETYQLQDSSLLDKILVYLTFELNSNILFISTRANRLVPNVSFEIYQQALQLNVRLSP